MPASIGVNLRVTGHCRQGGRKYMEDFFSVAYQQTEDERDLEYAFFGIYDGHGGAEAAAFAKEHLMETIVKQKNFWSDNDEDVLRAIKDGYIATHYAMWKEQEKWPKTASGLPSTAGTTASVAFIRRGKIYIGHVGDSGIILGYQEPGNYEWWARPLTKEHKPENALEMSRIESCGGKVVSKSGVPRVVWNRPRIGHQGPVRRSTPIDEIPFLAVARSLGDLWSYNSQLDEFVVSPDPDCSVIPIDTNTFRCLIFGTDGLYNMLSPQMAVHIVQQAERHNENAALSDDPNKVGWLNPSKCLVEKALERWSTTKMRADNTSVVTLMLDPPGPPRAQVLKNKKRNSAYPDSGLKIVTRYEDSDSKGDEGVKEMPEMCPVSEKDAVAAVSEGESSNGGVNTEEEKSEPVLSEDFVPKPRESLAFEVRKPSSDDVCSSIDQDVLKPDKSSENIQIHEISSSSSEIDEENNEKSITYQNHKKKMDVPSTTYFRKKENVTSSKNCPGNEVAEVQRTLRSASSKTSEVPDRKRRLTRQTSSGEGQDESPRKKLRISKSDVAKTTPQRKLRVPPAKPEKKRLNKVSKVVLRQKIRALQRIMTSKTTNLSSGIIFEKRKIKAKEAVTKKKSMAAKERSPVVRTTRRTSRLVVSGKAKMVAVSKKKTKIVHKNVAKEVKVNKKPSKGPKVCLESRRSSRRSVVVSKAAPRCKCC